MGFTFDIGIPPGEHARKHLVEDTIDSRRSALVPALVDARHDPVAPEQQHAQLRVPAVEPGPRESGSIFFGMPPPPSLSSLFRSPQLTSASN